MLIFDRDSVFSLIVQLLHKLSIHAANGPIKLMKVILFFFSILGLASSRVQVQQLRSLIYCFALRFLDSPVFVGS